MTTTNIKPKKNNTILIKILFILFMIVLLMIPNFMIKNLIYERSGRKAGIENEIARSFGKSQKVMSPILKIPYTKTQKLSDGKTNTFKGLLSFAPSDTDMEGSITPTIRERSIYEVVVYDAEMNIKSKIETIPNSSQFVNYKLDYSQAYLMIGLADPNGLKDSSSILVNGKKLELEGVSDYANRTLHFLKSKPFAIKPQASLELDIKLDFRGTSSLTVEPIGETTKVNLQAPWPDPSFVGSKLPNSRDVTEAGFTSNWTTNKFAHNYPRQWTDNSKLDQNYEYGVKLLQPVDEYGKNSRTAKYALLIIVLAFSIFFLFEILQKIPIHPIQYALVGFALTIFFLLLLSITEHLGFDLAYLISGLATIGLIVSYTSYFLASSRSSLILLLLLSALFGYIFVILQMQDFALLAGSLALFVVLSLVMLLSRKVDWYKLGYSTNEIKTS